MPVEIFCCYAREDEDLLNKLKTHLTPLQRQGLIDIWHDRDISAGTEWELEINKHLNEANIILLLVSPDFMASDYCYSIEMQRALERHKRKEARVIPVILRPVYWLGAPFGKLLVLPKDGKPVIGSAWHNQDEAFLNVADGIRKVVEKQIPKPLAPLLVPVEPLPQPLSNVVAIAEEARKLEEQFQANGYKGSDGPDILEIKGTLPVVLSAPHAVAYPRKKRLKEAQWNTGAIALQLAEITGASAIVAARSSTTEDPNSGEPGLYKQKLEALVAETDACFVLDVHGSDANFVRQMKLGQVEIGTAYGKSLLRKFYLRDMLVEAFENAGITVTVDKYFDADRSDTITLYTSEILKTPAMQLEITRSLRDLDNAPQKYAKFLSVLSDAIFAMNMVCSERKD